MLHHGQDAAVEHAFDRRPAKVDDDGRIVGEGAVADHGIGTFDRNVKDRSTIDVDTELKNIVRDKTCIEIGSLARRLGRRTMKGPESSCRPPLRPVRRIKSCNASTFLSDQNRSEFVADAIAQRLDQSAYLVAVDDVASEQNESPRLRIGKESPLVGRQFRSGKTVNGPRAHEFVCVRFCYLAIRQLAPSALSLSQIPIADCRSANEPIRSRYQMPLTPRFTSLTPDWYPATMACRALNARHDWFASASDL
jgi:hypothetical protein